jgi:hypothetical protein
MSSGKGSIRSTENKAHLAYFLELRLPYHGSLKRGLEFLHAQSGEHEELNKGQLGNELRL